MLAAFPMKKELFSQDPSCVRFDSFPASPPPLLFLFFCCGLRLLRGPPPYHLFLPKSPPGIQFPAPSLRCNAAFRGARPRCWPFSFFFFETPLTCVDQSPKRQHAHNAFLLSFRWPLPSFTSTSLLPPLLSLREFIFLDLLPATSEPS